MIRLVLAAALVTLALAACGTDERAADDPLANWKQSGVAEAPIPQGAEPDGEGQWRVPGATYDELTAFYEEQMPEGDNWFGGWRWCDTGGGETIHSHIYARGKDEILAVTVTGNGILIGTDHSGPC